MRKFVFKGPDLPGYMGGRFCIMAWRTAMMIFRNIAQSNKTSPPLRGYLLVYYNCIYGFRF